MQFFHFRVTNLKPDIFRYQYYADGIKAKGGETVVMQELKSWFINSLNEGEFFTKLVGRAKCSDQDNYNKKIGRELSSSRMKMIKLTVIKILIFSNIKEVELIDEENNKYIIQSRVEDNAGNARFVNYTPKVKK